MLLINESDPLKMSGLVPPILNCDVELFVRVTLPEKVLPPLLVSLLLAVLITDTEPLNTDPLKNILPVEPLTFAPNVVPLKVEVPGVLSVTAAAAPPLLIVPVANVLVPVVVRLKPFRSIMPVYPLTVMPATVGATSNKQLPEAVALNVTKSDGPGTPAGNQLAPLFQFDADAEIHVFCAKDAVERSRKRTTR